MNVSSRYWSRFYANDCVFSRNEQQKVYFVSNTSLRLYADDRTEYAFEPSPMVLQYVINSDLSVLSTRFEPNYVKIDAPKTQALAIGPSI